MKASEFFRRHEVTATAIPVALYDRLTDEAGSLMVTRRKVWGLALSRNEVHGNRVAQRVLRMTHETGTDSTLHEAFDWNAVLPALVSDVGSGAMPFDEFVVEVYDRCSDPVQAYELWQGHVWWRGQVEAWLRGNTLFRVDFYGIGNDQHGKGTA